MENELRLFSSRHFYDSMSVGLTLKDVFMSAAAPEKFSRVPSFQDTLGQLPSSSAAVHLNQLVKW